MTIVGFLFTKMHAEKNDGVKGNVNIANNVSITDVQESEATFSSSEQKGLKFLFKFTSKYNPEIGEIALEGNVLYMDKKEEVKKILAKWKKDKNLDKEIMKGILNTILTKSYISALILSKEIALPPPIPMPKVESK